MPLQTIRRQKYPHYLELILNKPFLIHFLGFQGSKLGDHKRDFFLRNQRSDL